MRLWLARRLTNLGYRLGAEQPHVEAPPAITVPDDSARRELEAHLVRQQRLAESARSVAQGNLARDVEGSDALATAFRDMQSGLRRLVGQVKDATLDVDRGAREQMTQVHAAAEAIGSVSYEVDRVAQVATELAASSQSARQAADRDATAVSSTVEGMRAIADSSAAAAERVRHLDALAQQIGAVVATMMRILASDSGPSIGVAFIADPSAGTPDTTSRAARRPAA